MQHDDLMEVWNDLITKASKFVAYDFPNVEAEDLYQSLWVFVLETPSLDPHRQGIYTLLTRKAKAIAWNQRKEDLALTAQYTYRTSDVREILEDIFEYESWASGYCPADAKGDDGMGSIDVRADVTWAMDRLPPQYQEIILSRYRHGVQSEANSAERRKLNRAIKRLTDTLNSYYRSSSISGHPGRRRVITNAEAQFLLEEQDGS